MHTSNKAAPEIKTFQQPIKLQLMLAMVTTCISFGKADVLMVIEQHWFVFVEVLSNMDVKTALCEMFWMFMLCEIPTVKFPWQHTVHLKLYQSSKICSNCSCINRPEVINHLVFSRKLH